MAALADDIRQLATELASERRAREELERRLPQVGEWPHWQDVRGGEQTWYVFLKDTECYHLERSGWAE